MFLRLGSELPALVMEIRRRCEPDGIAGRGTRKVLKRDHGKDRGKRRKRDRNAAIRNWLSALLHLISPPSFAN
jgi:hypothetical protein